MLNVKFDPNRNHDVGQYFVELVAINHERPDLSCRFGYWCDKGHLKTMAHEILKEFNYELVKNLLD